MSFFDWFRRKQSQTYRVITAFLPLGRPVSPRVDYASLVREGYGKNAVVFACIREISEAAAGVPWILRRRRGGRTDEVEDHPLLDLMARPNPVEGQFEFIQKLFGFYFLAGNAYIESAGPESPNVPPRELYLLRPDRTRVVPSARDLVDGYDYTVSGRTVRFEREKVLHLKLFHPLDDFYGLSPIQVAALAVDKMNEGDRWNAMLMQNAAVPSGALVSKESLTDEQFKRLRGEMRDQVQGASNAREPLLLESGLEWKEMGMTPRDLDWTEGLKMSALQVAQIYNVPPELIGLQPATYQNRKEARKALYTEVVCPALARLRDALNTWLVPRFGGDLGLDFDKDGIEALSEDQESLWKRVNDTQVLTVNEKRGLLGFDERPDGDVIFVGVSDLPLSDAVGGVPEEEGEGGSADEADEESTRCLHPRLEGKAFSPEERRRFRREFRAVARHRDRLQAKWRPRIRRRLQAETREVVKGFERGGQTGALDAVTRGEGEWEDLFIDMGLDVLKTFGVRTLRGLKHVDPEIEIKQGDVDDAIDAFEEAALQFARREAAQKIKNVTAGSKALINRIVTRTVDEGLGIPETTAAIQEELNGIHPRRARTIARTEVHNAQTQGQVESVRTLGLDDLEKGWLWSGVSRTEHKAMDSVWVGLNDQFDVPEADAPMDRPGDPAGGPQAVINCACTLVFRRRRQQGGTQQ